MSTTSYKYRSSNGVVTRKLPVGKTSDFFARTKISERFGGFEGLSNARGGKMQGRKRSYPDVAAATEARKARRGDIEIGHEMIRHMEVDAYHAVLKAFNAQSDSLSWDRVAMMTKLRHELNIADDEHAQLLVQIRRNGVRTSIQEISNVNERFNDVIEIRATEKVVSEVERLLDCREFISAARLEEAKRVLQEHERAIVEALDKLGVDDEAAGG